MIRYRFGRMVASLALGVAALGGAAAVALPAAPAYAYGPKCTISIQINIIPTTGLIIITIECGNTSGLDVFTILLHSTPVVLGTVTLDSNGFGTGTFHVPAGIQLGNHTITATDASGQVLTTSVKITGAAVQTAAAPVAPTTHSLSFTGTDAAATAGGAAVLVGAGGLIVLATRRRRQRA
jgi:hypothetical protein